MKKKKGARRLRRHVPKRHKRAGRSKSRKLANIRKRAARKAAKTRKRREELSKSLFALFEVEYQFSEKYPFAHYQWQRWQFGNKLTVTATDIFPNALEVSLRNHERSAKALGKRAKRLFEALARRYYKGKLWGFGVIYRRSAASHGKWEKGYAVKHAGWSESKDLAKHNFIAHTELFYTESFRETDHAYRVLMVGIFAKAMLRTKGVTKVRRHGKTLDQLLKLPEAPPRRGRMTKREIAEQRRWAAELQKYGRR